MIVVINSGTYYLDQSTLEVECDSQINQVATPTFTPAPGIYDSPQTVMISSNTPDAVFYYTTNGDDPSDSSTPYNQPINIDKTTTIKAKTYKDGWTPSDIAIGALVINAADSNLIPTILPLLLD